MRPTSSLCLALLMGPPAMLAAQDQSPKADRLLTVAVGVGNEVGFVGGQAEWYVHGDRLSVFGGAGRWRQLAVASGLRGYLGRGRARPFLELAGLPLRGVDGPTEGRVSYGPSVRFGVQLVRASGLTVVGAAGFGQQLGSRPLGSRTVPTAGIGVGFTLRR